MVGSSLGVSKNPWESGKPVWETWTIGAAERLAPEIIKIMEEGEISSPILAFRTYFDGLKGIEGENHFDRFSNFFKEVLGIKQEMSAQIRKMYAFIYPDKVDESNPGFTGNTKSDKDLLYLIWKKRLGDGINEPALALESLINDEVVKGGEKDKEETEKRRVANPMFKFREASYFEIFQRALAGLFKISVEKVKGEFLGGLLLLCVYNPAEFLEEIKRRRGVSEPTI